MSGIAKIHWGSSLTPGKVELITGWIGAQRWFGGSDEPTLTQVGAYRFVDPTGRVGIETLLVRDDSATPAVLYQVPLTYRPEPLDGAEAHLVGTVEHEALGTRYAYDGPHDPVYAAELLRTVITGDTGAVTDRGETTATVVGDGVVRPGDFAIRSSKVLSGEQSNTSIIYDALDVDGNPSPLICKVFRIVNEGLNPDVTTQTALAHEGSQLVPAPVGALTGRWPGHGKAAATGHLAFAQEFLPGVEDAWRVALRSVAAGEDFTARARALGVATGQVHRDLATSLPTREASELDRDALRLSMQSRFVLAAEQAPELRREEELITGVLSAVTTATWPKLQRIHGDYHLGQVLDVPGRGWVLLDFEGEPLRPLSERSEPDLPLRDVAGMLRSFDYAGGSYEQSTPGASGAAWVQACREAFLDGYAEAYGSDPRQDPRVLRALELDKALYEVLYEAKNRPSWLPIPTTAIARLLADAEQEEDMTTEQPKGASRPTNEGPVEKAKAAAAAAVGAAAAKAEQVKDAAVAKAEQVKDAAATKAADAKDAATEAKEAATAKAAEVKDSATAKAADVKDSAAAKATEVKDSATAKAAEVKDAAAEQVAQRKDAATLKAAEVKDQAADAAAGSGSGRVAVTTDQINRLVAGHHHNPHDILGPHVGDGVVTVRVLRPNAETVDLVMGETTIPMEREHSAVFVADVPGTDIPDYRLAVDYGDGFKHTSDDPYRYLPTLGEIDLHLIGEGRHEQLWTVLGSHVHVYEGPLATTKGVSFAVWAPNAVSVRVSGDFNNWDSQAHPMRSMGVSGVWELFVPGVEPGAKYKYEIFGQDGHWRSKADPMARRTEVPPATASIVDESTYTWNDDAWVAKREKAQPHQEPMSIYEVHLGSWRAGLTYEEMADQLVSYVADLGFTHVEFMPVAEHPYAPSWGYQVTGYYAPTSRFGTPDQFRALVDAFHAEGIGVIVDWVPAHFPKDAWALARFDGMPLYEHPDPRRGDQPDWGTHVFDFGRPQVRNFLVANALYWFEEFHIDGLRVDAVASMLYLDYSRKDGEWVPNQFGGREHLEAVQFLQETDATVYKKHPGVMMIAEESTSWPGVTRPTHLGGLGFGFKWNMGWMHDTLNYIEHEPIHRQYHHHEMTFAMVYAWSENFVLPISHDEVVYGKGSLLRKMPGDRWQQLANLRAYLAFMWAHPGKQLIFMGAEFAQEAEWAATQSLDWWLLDQPWHLPVHQMVKSMNATYKDAPALWELDISPEGFRWIDANDAQGNVFSFLRFGNAPHATADPVPGRPVINAGELEEIDTRPVVAVVSNFSGSPHYQYRIGLPRPGVWREVLNTDASEWNGSGVGNMGQVVAEEIGWHGLPYSAEITVPPLATVWFRPEDDAAAPADED